MLGKVKYIAVMLGVVVGFLNCLTTFAQDTYKIIDTSLDKSQNLFMINGTVSSDNIHLTGGALSDPDRIFIDIHNAVLAGPKQHIELSNPHIKDIRIAQFSLDPNVVRIVITADSQDSLSKINVGKYSNSIALRFGELALELEDSIVIFKDKAYIDGESKFTKVYRKVNVVKTKAQLKPSIISIPPKDSDGQQLDEGKSFLVNKVVVKDGRIGIRGIGQMDLRPHFILEEPYRVVFDIKNVKISSPDLLREEALNGKDKVRIGYFEDRDLRIVINTEDPDKYVRVISPDMQSMIIAPKGNLKYPELIDSSTQNKIENIEVKQLDPKSTLVSINSEEPFIYDIKRTIDNLELSLYNSKPLEESEVSNVKTTGQFRGLQFDEIEQSKTGTKLVIPIKNGISTEARFSYDARHFKILLTDNLLSEVNVYIGNNRKIVLDPGHGGYDSGAVGAGILEKDISLDVSKLVKKYLTEAGVKVVMTRSSDATVSLKKRTIVNSNQMPDAFVSIHVNASEKPAIKGLETHWYTQASKRFAQIVHNNFTMGVASPDRGLFRSRFYVINHTRVPSILVEIGFITNEQERYQLISETRKEDTARSITNGILMYLASKYEKQGR